MTGKGHFTDGIIIKTMDPVKTTVHFEPTFKGLKHPNTMDCKAIFEDGSEHLKRYLSIGGGAYTDENGIYEVRDAYPFSTFNEMVSFMHEHKVNDIYNLIEMFEDDDILQYGISLLKDSFHTLEEALKRDCLLPGELGLSTVSGKIQKRAKETTESGERRILFLTAYAYATSESNALGKMVVTAPTCGSAGVVPAVLYYEYKNSHYSIIELAKAYLVGALVCNFIKENASLSGALLGCQAEIGSASSFASASLSYLHHLSVKQIEYASEVAMEHFLGLTCDPVNGYVQIPCIERNAMAAIHSYASYLFAKDISPYRCNKVSFDNVVSAMRETGNGLPTELKETSLGGLAKILHC